MADRNSVPCEWPIMGGMTSGRSTNLSTQTVSAPAICMSWHSIYQRTMYRLVTISASLHFMRRGICGHQHAKSNALHPVFDNVTMQRHDTSTRSDV
ncbi:hypothetical protein M3J09_004179 [Ascochyta lentis]